MSRWSCLKSWPVLLALLAAGAARQAWGQNRFQPRYIEPRWFTFRLSEVSVGVYAEGEWDQTSYLGAGSQVTYIRSFIGPALGLQANGSVYHPNFMRYYLTTDGALGWAHNTTKNGTSSSLDEFQYLGTVSLNADLLSGKDVNGTAFLNYDHSYHDNDFFSRVMVESWRYGGQLNWDGGPWRAGASYSGRNETSTSEYPVTSTPGSPNVTQDSTTIEDTFNAFLRHRRESGESAAEYYFHQYRRTDYGQTGEGTDQSVILGDSENFGDLFQHHFFGNGTYTHRDSLDEISDEFLVTSSLSLEHRHNLLSYFDASYDYFTLEDYTSGSFAGQGSLQHQLYDSLNSAVIVRGSDQQFNSDGSDGFNSRYGGGISESYTKMLTEEHRLKLGASVYIDHTDEQAIGTVKNERHEILATGEPGAPSPYSFLLNQPNVNQSTIVITDTSDTLPAYLPGFDYAVSTLGNQTVITWLRPPGPGTPTAVLVDYEAEPRPPGSYNTISQNYLVRFELWRNLLGVYGRVGMSDNDAPADLQVLEFVNYAAGADVTYKQFRAGAEYQLYDSTESDYSSIRLYQSLGLRPDDFSSLGFDFMEYWIHYLDTDRREENYQFLTRFNRALNYRLQLGLDAGVSYRNTEDVDQLLAVFRPRLKYNIGKTSLELGYDFSYQLFIDDQETYRNYLYLRLKRVL